MALHDYRCPCCGFQAIDVHRSAAEGAQARPPICPSCSLDLVWIPQIGRMDLKTDGEGGRGFQKFTVHRQTAGGPREETIDSLHKLRQIERESEQRFRDGEGEPIRFRGYSQDRSNLDTGSFGTEGRIGERAYDSGKTPQKSKRLAVRRHGEREPEVAVAQGGGVSAIKES